MMGDLGVVWGISLIYKGRTHIVPRGWNTALCRLPVHDKREERPYGYRICPECAIAWVSVIFPTSPPDRAVSPEGTPP
jgi:hypothetical protein